VAAGAIPWRFKSSRPHHTSSYHPIPAPHSCAVPASCNSGPLHRYGNARAGSNLPALAKALGALPPVTRSSIVSSIFAQTADEAAEIEPAGLDGVADDYLAKSAGPDILLLRVRALLRNSDARSSVLAPQEAYFRRARLLVIEVSPVCLKSLAEVFSSEGHEVTQAASGKEGLERLARDPFDCVMVDLIMPRWMESKYAGAFTRWYA
jgi:DNA-binding NarL/FixJ family response regulator